MSNVQWTPEQKNALNSTLSPLLVSAAAGSGKTAVLIERVLRRVCDEGQPVDITKFLLVTFTNAAAAEMREKLGKALYERLQKDPTDKHIERQISLLTEAHITTVHAFCQALIKENRSLLGLGDFRLMDTSTGEPQQLQQEILQQILQKRYANPEGYPGFLEACDLFSERMSLQGLADTVLHLFDRLGTTTNPTLWMEKTLAEYKLPLAATPYAQIIFDTSFKTADFLLSAYEALLPTLYDDPVLGKAYGPSMHMQLEQLKTIHAALGERNWDAAYHCAKNFTFEAFSRSSSKADQARKESATALRNRCKKFIEKCTTGAFSQDKKSTEEDLLEIQLPVSALFSIVSELIATLQEVKFAEGTLDFNDLEQLTLQLLVEAFDEEGQISEVTPLAKALSERFLEVMVDEYQDTNLVQDCIFTALSNRGANLFMVGDVKQSIYRFRYANPTIFLKYYKEFPLLSDKNETGGPYKINLTRNFRSRPEVLDFVNALFSSMMSDELGELQYGDAERLYFGAAYYEEQERKPVPEIFLLDTTAIDASLDEDEELVGIQMEAAHTAAKIAALLSDPLAVQAADGTFRRAQPGDIAILLRAKKESVSLPFVQALEALGISARAEKSEPFFSAPEVLAVLSFLRVIDNPLYDIALASALRSPLFGFSVDRLTELAERQKGAPLFAALQDAKEQADVAEFLAVLDYFSERQRFVPMHILIEELYEKTQVRALFDAFGLSVYAGTNLDTLYNLAFSFGQNGRGGLFDFLRDIDRMMASGAEPTVQKVVQGDAVHIMTMHKSKGLEFPIVFVCALDRAFYLKDAQAAVIADLDVGFGCNLMDRERGITYTSLPREALARNLKRLQLSEELRLLYVALTRAKERLFLSMKYAKPANTIAKLLAEQGEGSIHPEVLFTDKCMADWVLRTLLISECSRPLYEACGIEPQQQLAESAPFLLHPVTEQCAETEMAAPLSEAPANLLSKEEYAALLQEELGYQYPNAAACAAPSKITPTAIVKAQMGVPPVLPVQSIHFRNAQNSAAEDEEDSLSTPLSAVKQNSFPSVKSSNTDRGITMHLAMQYIDLAACGTIEDVESFITLQQKSRTITAAQRSLISTEQIFKFAKSDLCKLALSSPLMEKEFSFSVLLPAQDYYSDVAADEEVLLQGVIDLFFLEADGTITIIDYKTNAVNEATEQEAAAQYKLQLDTYQKALESIFNKKVGRRFIWFFETGHGIPM